MKKDIRPKETKEERKYKVFDPTASYKWYDLRTFMLWWKKKNNDSRNILINMELNNGFHVSFLASDIENYFVWDKKVYIIDLNLKYYSISSKYWCLDYHQSFALPIKRKIDVDAIQTAMESTGVYESETAVNPANIHRFMKSSIIQKIITGDFLMKAIRIIIVLLAIILVISALHFIAFAVKSGMLQQVPNLFSPKK